MIKGIDRNASNKYWNWRGINKYRNFVEQNTPWIVRDGYNVRFWQDSWVPGIGPLHEHSPGILDMDWNRSVAIYASTEGWRWKLIDNALPRHICNKIASVNFPKPSQDDFPIWAHSSNGFFSLKSAYNSLYTEMNQEPPSFPFDRVWKWQGPARIRTFLWKLCHQRIMTNSERMHRGMTDNDLCPKCLQQPESILHCLRDCEVITDIWNKLISEDLWSNFYSIGINQWLQANLFSTDFGQGQWHWPTVFGIMVNMIWQDRNQVVFANNHSNPEVFMQSGISHINLVYQEVLNPTPKYMEASKQFMHIRWLPPPQNASKLNTDGSHMMETHLSACGGLIRNHLGQFVAGFHCNLGSATSVLAELWGLIHGLKLAISLHVPWIIVELDSEVVINMIKIKRSLSLYFKPLEEAIDLLEDDNWICSVHHIYREGNRCADILVNLGHYGPLSCTTLESIPPQLMLCLEDDARGPVSLD